MLTGDNKYEWTKCRTKTDATKSIMLEESPLNLIVSLKRFDKFGTKIKSSVDYPLTFNMNDYITHQSKNGCDDVTYELYAVINHEGRFSTKGHYTCYVKGYDQSWYICDDNEITKVGKNHKKSTKAYILFYRLSEKDKRNKIKQRRISDSCITDIDSDDQSEKMMKPRASTKACRKRSRRIASSLSFLSKQEANTKTKSESTISKMELRRTRSNLKRSDDSQSAWWNEGRCKRTKIDEYDYFESTAEC